MNLADLSAELPREYVHWRVQGTPFERNGRFSAMALAYIDARDVMDTFDRVCGPENWQDRYTETPRGRIICEIGIKVSDDWVWKSDGAGETAVEGEKGGISDALKRAAVHWGVGRYLYRLSSPWVACEVKQKNGKTYWKEWAEDPWSKVKKTSYVSAETNRADELAEASIKAAIHAIETEPEMEGLQAYFIDLNKTDRATAGDPRVVAAKDKRKQELSQKEAA